MLVRNFAGARRLAQLARPAIEQRLQQNGVTLLYTMPWPPTRLFSSFAMASLAPLRGTRLRTMTPMGGRLANLLGAYAARVEAEEPAMVSAGRIATSMLAPATMGVEMAAWSFAQFYIPIDSAFFKNAVCVQTRAFNALSGGLRGIMMNAAGAAEIRGWAMASDEVGISEAALVSHGMMLRPASATLIADLTRVGAVMKEEWLGRAGGRGQRLLAALGS
jgi:TRAP-type C4-dicarboxylate transport system substrate-binding protein